MAAKGERRVGGRGAAEGVVAAARMSMWQPGRYRQGLAAQRRWAVATENMLTGGLQGAAGAVT